MAKPNDAMLLCSEFGCGRFFNGLRSVARSIR
jgi:hypothetical protein